MKWLDRAIIKSQAKQLIKGKWFVLFVVSIVAITLVEGISVSISARNIYKSTQYFANSIGSDSDYGDNNFFDDDFGYGLFNDDHDTNPIDDFDFKKQSLKTDNAVPMVSGGDISVSGNIFGLIGFFLSPLVVVLYGNIYLSFIRRRPDEPLVIGSLFGQLFKSAFDENYVKKLLVSFLRGLFTVLWTILLIIPGIVYMYSSYFAYQIMCEYPNLKPTEALKLSKKMVKGNRTELFVLDLSFIPWYLLTCITFGIASIYVLPYIQTTQALYYENFRLRALANGVINENDFLSADELTKKYSGTNMNNAQAYGSYQQSQQGNYYYQQPQQNNNYYQPPQAEPQYQQPTQNAPQYQQPQYTQPPQNTEPVQTEQQPSQPAGEESNYYTPPENENNN